MADYKMTVSAGARIYYLDVRRDKANHAYLSITEMNVRNKTRNCIYIHPECIDKVIDALSAAKGPLTEAATDAADAKCQ